MFIYRNEQDGDIICPRLYVEDMEIDFSAISEENVDKFLDMHLLKCFRPCCSRHNQGGLEDPINLLKELVCQNKIDANGPIFDTMLLSQYINSCIESCN